MGLSLNPLTDLEDVGKDIGREAKDFVTPGYLLNKGIDEGKITTGTSPAEAPKAKGTAKKAAPLSPAKQATDLTEFANMLAEKYASEPLQAIGQEGTTLANENMAVTQAITPLLEGQAPSGNSGSATPAVQAAMDAYAKAYATGEGVNSAAYANMGLANEQFLAASPEASYLQLLSQPGSAYYKEIPAPLLKELPESLQYALETIGQVNEGTNPVVPKGGFPKSVTNEFGTGVANPTAANYLTSGLGTTPGSPASPSSLGTGNPNTPGA